MTASEEQPPGQPARSAHRDQLTFRAEGQPFLNVLPVVGKTVSNIPVSMVAVIEGSPGPCLVTASRAEASGMFRGDNPWLFLLIRRLARARDGTRVPGASKAALSIGLSLPDGHLVRNAA